MTRKVRLEKSSALGPKQVRKLETTLQIFPPENALDYYQRHICSSDSSKLSQYDQDAALGILKILDALS